jgi:BCD family chlorophyll transporter-like MFS transporter
VLGIGGITASCATAWMATDPVAGAALAALATALAATATGPGVALAVLAFILIGGGVGASGTSLLALLATDVAPERRAPAASITWIMMIMGFAVTAGLAGSFLDPFTLTRLVAVTAAVCAAAFALCTVAVWGVERKGRAAKAAAVRAGPKLSFKQAMNAVWAEPKARRFTVFVFIAMLAFSTQDLIMEPFGGLVFDMTVGESTQLAGMQQGGVLLGMIAVAVLGARLSGGAFGRRQHWVAGGCVASSLALVAVAAASLTGPGWPLLPTVFVLGAANGVFAVAAIGTMMGLAGADGAGREGIRVGLWGAAQAIAFALGGFLGAAAIDLTRALLDDVGVAFALVFAAQALLFLLAARLAMNVEDAEPLSDQSAELAGGTP